MKKQTKPLQKIKRKQLKRMDMFFNFMAAFLLLGLLLSSYPIVGLGIVFMALYVWGFYNLKCPICGNMVYPWVAQKAIKEEVFCTGCGFRLDIEQ